MWKAFPLLDWYLGFQDFLLGRLFTINIHLHFSHRIYFRSITRIRKKTSVQNTQKKYYFKLLIACTYHLHYFGKMVASSCHTVLQQRPCDYGPSETHSKCHKVVYFLEPCQQELELVEYCLSSYELVIISWKLTMIS